MNETQKPVKPLCPECGTPMFKSGFAWSGKNRPQRYKCPKCGRTTIKKYFEKGIDKTG